MTKTVMAHLRQAKVAREAFQAYEKAIKAAQEVIAAGPIPVSGTTTVMTESHGGRYSCAECEGSGFAKGWKFCPFCGAEIMRFENRSERNPFTTLPLGETARVICK